MKRRALLLALSGAATLQAAPAQRGERVQWPAVRLLDGQPWQAREGHAVVVVFWSLDCPFCERHNAHVERLHRAAAGRPLQLLSAARGGSAATVQQHMAARGWRFPTTLDTAALGEALSRRRSVPLTLCVDRGGRLQELIPGEMFEEDVLGLLKWAD